MKFNSLFALSLLTGLIQGQDERIIGGFTVQPDFKYPWMVAIYRYGDYFCGGTLLTHNKVITAAHCMGGTIGPLEYFEVQVHRHNLTKSVQEEKGKSYKVTKRWVPKDYDKETYYNDIAIIELDNSDKRPTTMQINTRNDYKDGFRVTALGWGAIKIQQAPYPILQEVWLPLSNSKDCQKVYKQQLNYTIIPTQICAGYRQGGKDTCQGDSGGPLFTYVNDKPLLVGITSNGISCAQPNTPALYTRIAKFNTWIKGVLSGKIPESPTTEPTFP